MQSLTAFTGVRQYCRSLPLGGQHTAGGGGVGVGRRVLVEAALSGDGQAPLGALLRPDGLFDAREHSSEPGCHSTLSSALRLWSSMSVSARAA